MTNEQYLLAKIHSQGIENPMLAEHVLHGLPTLDTFKKCLSEDISMQAWFSGNFQYNLLCFRVDHLFGVNRLKWLKAIVAMILNLLGNMILLPLTLSVSPKPRTNRMFIVLQKS